MPEITHLCDPRGCATYAVWVRSRYPHPGFLVCVTTSHLIGNCIAVSESSSGSHTKQHILGDRSREATYLNRITGTLDHNLPHPHVDGVTLLPYHLTIWVAYI